MAANPFERITSRILEALERGAIPWRRTWRVLGRSVGPDTPRNLKSQRPYRGVNVVVLSLAGFSSPWWATFNQVKAMGGRVRKGSHGTPIIFWSFDTYVRDRDTGERKRIPILRHFTVFNLAQTEGIEAPPSDATDTEPEAFEPIDAAAKIAEGYVDGPGVRHCGDAAYYSPMADMVTMPAPAQFETREAYYSTLFHELGHSTGHAERLARPGVTDPIAFGSHRYSREELVAEFTAAFLSGEAGITGDRLVENSAAYIAHWAKVIHDDPRACVVAIGAAVRAANRILGVAAADAESGDTEATS